MRRFSPSGAVRARDCQQTREFLDALYAEALKRDCWKLLVCVRASQPIFRVEQYGLSELLAVLTRQPHQVALLSDSSEVHASHGYVELLARQKNVNVRAFADENAALAWLRER